MIATSLLRELIAYDQQTGVLTWRKRPLALFKSSRDCNAWNRLYAERPALNAIHSAGYRHGAIFGVNYLAHRVAWAISHDEWPGVIDHINGVRNDNRLANLRAVTVSQNLRNQRLSPRNRSGYPGVFRRPDGRFIANILEDGKTRYLGLFDTVEEAAAVRREAQKRLGYHPNHGNHFDGKDSEAANNRPEVAA